MCSIYYTSTASFSVENARELGIPAALLLDKIIRLSKHTTREDGYCWYTAKQFEEETSLGDKTFARAVKTLEDRGIIQKKVTYIIGTMNKATHFILSPQNAIRNPQNGESETDNLSGSIETDNLSGSVNTINNNKTILLDASFQDGRGTQHLEPSNNDHQSHYSVGEPANAVSSESIDDSPFERPTAPEPQSVKPIVDKKEKPALAQPFAILGEVYKYYQLRGAPSVVEARLVRRALDDGWSSKEIKDVVDWAMRHEYWGQAPLHVQLKTEVFKQYEAQHRQKPVLCEDPTVGMTETQKHAWLMNHDNEYAQKMFARQREMLAQEQEDAEED